MTAVIMREKSHELKEMLHRALDIAEQMCEGGEMGERGGYGMREHDYPYGDRMGMRDYPQYPYEMGERRGVRGTGRYSRY